MVKKITFTRNILKDKKGESIKWRTSKIIQIKPKFKGTIKREDMIKSIDKINEDLKSKDFKGSMLISIHDPNTGKKASRDLTSILSQKPSVSRVFIDSSGKVEDVENVYEDLKNMMTFVYILLKPISHIRMMPMMSQNLNPNIKKCLN